MNDTICRAITFINYNIPIRNGIDTWDGFDKYYTTGFFDCMYTRKIDCDYTRDQLRNLWDYNIECIAKGEGRYSHQNVFCFSQDAWNTQITDEEFWSIDHNPDMLLTFIVFVQTKNYTTDITGIEKQCHRFNNVVHTQLQDNGHVYTYGTVDKNDFVICIRSKEYKKAVDAIMKLHEAGCSIVYSYSVFGISETKYSQITDQEYELLNQQTIDSISLKGVTNSTRPEDWKYYALDQKYCSFCHKLVKKLYIDEFQQGKKPEFKIYDILGDNDFRLIARMVPLGNLIRQLGENGLLNYSGAETQFTFFSTNLILNTQDISRQSQIDLLDGDTVINKNELLKQQYKTEKCDILKCEMDQICEPFKRMRDKSQYIEKLTAACHGVYQLLQSLSALEAAPTKKYDFLSLYYPLKTLVNILKEKSGQESTMQELAESEYLYDFIHKISMTLHGTLRTDIQFFQIRDFNATVHYAPAKLRAYYTFFVFMLSAHIKKVSKEQNKHSYIFSSGMFKDIFVQQLCDHAAEKNRLMLITVPERYLYFPKNLSIILTHEVGHLAGDTIRKRAVRHSAFIQCAYRVLSLEITKLMDYELKHEQFSASLKNIDSYIPFNDEDFLRSILHMNHQLTERSKENPYQYYSAFSFELVQIVFANAGADFGSRTWSKYCSSLKKICQDCINQKYADSYNSLAKEIRLNYLFFDSVTGKLDKLFHLYRVVALPKLLKIFHYLMSEPVSDILAILILDLKPVEYLLSMSDELKSPHMNTQFDDSLNKERIALVIHTVQQLNNELNLSDDWKDVYKNLLPTLNKNSAIYSMALEAYSHQNFLCDKNSCISKYQSLLNQRKQAFSSKTYDFLNDRDIFQYMSNYLLKCAKEYMKQLSQNHLASSSKHIVANAFRNCVDSSPVDLMSQIDTFLNRFEQEWMIEYFDS